MPLVFQAFEASPEATLPAGAVEPPLKALGTFRVTWCGEVGPSALQEAGFAFFLQNGGRGAVDATCSRKPCVSYVGGGLARC